MKPLRVLVTGGSGFIGVHLVGLLSEQGYSVLNIDISAPLDNRNLDLWKNISLLDKGSLASHVLDFDPNFIVHLAAITTQNAKSLAEFEVNINGTENLVLAAKNLKSLKKLLFMSTQYVNTPGIPYSEDLLKLVPYGFYGESKLISEIFIRENFHSASWTILRPATIWGPWHPVLTKGLWKLISNGRYFHPRKDSVIKAYGYVENTAWQIEKIIRLESRLTDKKTFYLADNNMSQKEWVEGFVLKLRNHNLREIPRFILFFASEIGEVLKKFNIPFPLYKSRYRNLMTTNPSPITKTQDLLGSTPFEFQDGINRTCLWLKHKREC